MNLVTVYKPQQVIDPVLVIVTMFDEHVKSTRFVFIPGDITFAEAIENINEASYHTHKHCDSVVATSHHIGLAMDLDAAFNNAAENNYQEIKRQYYLLSPEERIRNILSSEEII